MYHLITFFGISDLLMIFSTGYEMRNRGFTLIELLVVIVVTGLLIALLLPAIQSAREMSRRAICVNNLKQFGLAIHQYATDHNRFPPGNSGKTQFSMHSVNLPYIEQMNVYNQVNFNNISILEAVGNKTVGQARISMFQCPSDYYFSDRASGDMISPNKTNYAGNVGDERMIIRPNGIIGYRPIGLESATDGLSTTVAMSEMLVGRKNSEYRLRTIYKSSLKLWGDTNNLELFIAMLRLDLLYSQLRNE
ncbi:MAG: DUF1559 domain-containing protein [bacterium]